MVAQAATHEYMPEVAPVIEDWMPVMSPEQVQARFEALRSFKEKRMVPDVDFGAIPGTDKPTLLKPGAEKLCTFFGLRIKFEIVEREMVWEEPFFFMFLYRCSLWRGDLCVAEADGLCNSQEAKYRWQRIYPAQGLSTEQVQAAYPGAVAKQKRSRDGRTFTDWYMPNADAPSLVNTIMKMAQKRALVAATLIAVNASAFFTQDVEDLPEAPAAPARSAAPQAPARPAAPPAQAAPARQASAPAAAPAPAASSAPAPSAGEAKPAQQANIIIASTEVTEGDRNGHHWKLLKVTDTNGTRYGCFDTALQDELLSAKELGAVVVITYTLEGKYNNKTIQTVQVVEDAAPAARSEDDLPF